MVKEVRGERRRVSKTECVKEEKCEGMKYVK